MRLSLSQRAPSDGIHELHRKIAQSGGISQISAALQNIEAESLKNRRGLEIVATSSDVLCDESNELNAIIGQLEAEVLGQRKSKTEEGALGLDSVGDVL